MPVRSSNTSVLVWPRKTEVLRALDDWADALRKERSDVVRAGYFGSLRTDRWGVGSDVDLVVVIERSDRPFIERPLEFDLSSLPVGADLLVYTTDEWDRLLSEESRFSAEMRHAVWLPDPSR